VQRKYSLDANSAPGDATDGKIGSRPFAVLAAYDHPLESLDALPITFPNAEIDPNGVSRPKLGNLCIFFQVY